MGLLGRGKGFDCFASAWVCVMYLYEALCILDEAYQTAVGVIIFAVTRNKHMALATIGSSPHHRLRRRTKSTWRIQKRS